MKMIVQTPDFKPNQKLLDFVTREVEKLDHLSDRIVEIRVCLKIEKTDSRDNKICELIGVMPGSELFAMRKSSAFEQATVNAVNALKRQVTDWKEKKKLKR